MRRDHRTATIQVLLWVLLGGCTVPNPNRRRDAATDASDTHGDVTYQYVFNRILVPISASQSTQFGLDLNGDGTVDNSLGSALEALAAVGLDVQASLDKAILAGKLITLASVQTPNFSTAAEARIRFYVGDQSLPAACNSDLDTVTCTASKPATCVGCGHHLVDGSFSIAASSPQNSTIAGRISDGAFTSGPGNVTFIISIMGKGIPIRFDLAGARIRASGMTESAIGGTSPSAANDGFVVAGAVTQEDVDRKVLPAVQSQLAAVIKKNCKSPSSPPSCGCTANSVGGNILGSIVNPNKDCMVTLDEIKSLASLLLRQDVIVDGNPAVSVGVRATAVKAKFAISGQ